MFVPEEMRRVSILTLEEDLERVSGQIGRLGVLHLFDVSELGDWATHLQWAEAQNLDRSYDALQRRLDSLFGTLNLPLFVGASEQLRIAPEEALAEAAEKLKEIEPEVGRLVDRRKEIHERLARLQVIAKELELLSPLSIRLGDLRQLSFLYLTTGLVPTQNLERLRGSLTGIPHLILPIRSYEGRMLIFAFTSQAYKDTLERALRAAYVEKTDLPQHFTGTPAEALTEVEQQRRRLEEADSRLTGELQAFANRHRDELMQMRSLVVANHDVVAAWTHLGRTEKTYLFSGWVPAATQRALVDRVEAASDRRAVVQTEAPERPQEQRAGKVTIPTAFQNPRIFRAFEGLVRTYGLPSYWELDPTPVAAILFLLMFGVMFGDLGQGAVLAIAGLLLTTGWLRLPGRELGPVLIGAGCSAMVFGLAYGSVFGSEELTPALLFRPIRDVTFFIEVAVAFGFLVITGGMLLNILSAWRGHEYRRLVWSEYGIVGLALYWGLGTIVLLLLVGAHVSVLLIVLLFGLPALLLYLHDPIAAFFEAGGRSLIPESGLTYFVESAVEVFDVTIRFISNTLSFLRLAAFALAHAGLGIMVFTLAALVGRLPLAGLVVIIVGNLVIIGLEALIVGIQTLRLEYYEFFTKFFAGRGVAYDPFIIETTRGRPQQTTANR